VSATVWVVDSLNNAGYGSLRAAVDSSSANDTIRFNPNLISSGNGVVYLDSNITFSKSLTITGIYSPSDSLIISGLGYDRLLNVTGGNQLILDSLILENGANVNLGGALFVEGVDSCFVTNSIIRNNEAQSKGGGLFFSSWSATTKVVIVNCEFLNNNLTAWNGGGAGVYVGAFDQPLDLYVSGSKFKQNSTPFFGGGLYVNTGGPLAGLAQTEIENCLFEDNIAKFGAGICNIFEEGGNVDINQTTVNNNNGVTPSSFGVGVYALTYYGNIGLNINTSTITNNKSDSCTGGAVYLEANYGASSLQITNSTLMYNNGIAGGGIYQISASGNVSAFGMISSVLALNGPSNIFIDGLTKCTSQGYNVFSNTSVIGQVASDSVNMDSTSINISNTLTLQGNALVASPIYPSVTINNGNPSDLTNAQNGPIANTRDRGAAEGCSVSSTDTHVECDSLVWLDGNTYYSNNQSAKFFTLNATGCDSIVTLDLTILPPVLMHDTLLACDSLMWIDGNTYYSSNSTATFVYPNGSSTGCDSTIQLALTVGILPTTDVVSSCDSLTWINGTTYYSSINTISDTLTGITGCDSVVLLDLTIYPTWYTTDSITTCDSLTWINGVTYYSSTNNPTDTLQSAMGCDSIVNLNLTIHQSSTNIDVIATCDSLTWVNGITYYQSSNTISDTLVSNNGCDSIVHLYLTIYPTLRTTDLISACDSLIWVNGITYYSDTNNVSDTLQSILGCDSIVTLNLTIGYPNTGIDVITACDSVTWIDGNTYTESNNIATYMLTNTTGCDSLVTLDLTMNHTTYGVQSVFAINDYTWIDGVTYYTSNTTATYVLTNSEGCDSIVTLDLYIQPVEVEVNQNGPRLSVGADSGTFQWVECPNYDIIPGATDSVFTPSQNGSYAVIVTQNGNTDTSLCITVNNVGIGEVNIFNNINIFPNPIKNQFTVEITDWVSAQINLTVRDVNGKQISVKNVKGVTGKQSITFNTQKWSRGVYFIQVTDGVNSTVKKLVVQ
jgi:hypothetical protein